MRVVRGVADARAAAAELRAQGPLGLVPTMGALHAGHRSLVVQAVQDCAVVAVSIFVNPLQFGPHEDLATYPRDLDADLALLAADGVALVFHPDPVEFTPEGGRTTVAVAGLTAGLEGASRPGHFDGVATIVTKLLAVLRPDVAYFGEKDFQQLAVIRALVADLDLGPRIVGCPIVREPDGLALSSRNAYLTPQQRRDALALSAALRAVAAGYDGDPAAARGRLRTLLEEAPGVRLDYAEVVDPGSLVPLHDRSPEPAQAVVAAFVGTTRLIDNLRLDPAAR